MLKLGTQLGSGPYHLLTRWASGGMADVYAARKSGQEGFDKIIALKLLRSDLADDARFREMFFAEARTAALLNHPHVVQTFDAGEIDNQFYIAMEFVNGESLQKIAETLQKKGAPMAPAMAADIIRILADALHYCHTLSALDGAPLDLVHRDISPQNVMITFGGDPKLLDFGIAKVSTGGRKTKVGTIKGKLAYMSPEQAQGEPVDARTDIYALGIVLWELLTGTYSIEEDSDMAMLRAAMRRNPKPPSQVGAECDSEMDKIVMRAVAREANDRYQDAHELAQALASWVRTKFPMFSGRTELHTIMKTHFAEESRRLSKVLKAAAAEGKTQQDHAPLGIASTGVWPPVEPGSASGPTTSGKRLSIESSPTEAMPALQTPATQTANVPAPKVARPRPVFMLTAGAGVLLALILQFAWSPVEPTVTRPMRAISVRSEPGGASIVVDGIDVDTTPAEIRIRRDRIVQLSIQRRGYNIWRQDISPDSNVDLFNASLEKAELYGTLKVRTTPAGAQITVDGKKRGVTPAIVDRLWVGEPHTVIVSLDGFEPIIEEVEFKTQRVSTVNITLDATGNGFLAANCAPRSCDLYVDGVKAGKTPVTNHAVPADRVLRVELRRRGKVKHAQSMRIKAGQLGLISYGKPKEVVRVTARSTNRDGRWEHEDVKDNRTPVVAKPDAARRVPIRPDAAPAQRPAPPKPPRLDVQVGRPRVVGVASSSRVTAALAKLRPEFKRCYQKAYVASAFTGTISVKVATGVDGRVRSVGVSGTHAKALSSCVGRAFRAARFPPSSTGLSLTVPLRLSATRP